MWYLVLYVIGQGSAIAIIPEKYTTEETCHLAAKPDRWAHSCILAPSSNDAYYNCAMSVPDPLNPGRYTIAKSHCELPTRNIVKGNKE